MDILCNNINCDGIGMRRADWDNFRECEDIVLNGQVIWKSYPLSLEVKSQIYTEYAANPTLAAQIWKAANVYAKSHPTIIEIVNSNPSIGSWIGLYPEFGALVESIPTINFSTPIYPANGVSDADRMWLYRQGRPTNWWTREVILSYTNWSWYKGGFGNFAAGLIGTDIRSKGSPFTIVKFFVPTTMPTGFQYTRADGGSVYLNDNLIASAAYNSNYDFTGKINLNRVNIIAVTCNGSNSWGTAMGFKF